LSGDLAPTTELEAVNDMLSVIQEAPVAALDETQPDAQLALRLLRTESRAVQAAGWQWNSDDNLTLLPDIFGEIALPANTLKVDTVAQSAVLDLVNRAGKLYDRVNHTFAIDAPVTVDLVTLLDFEEIPESARTYIKVRAGRKMLARTLGATDALGYEAKDETAALAVMEAEEEASADRSIFQNPEYGRLLPNRRPSR
jgi:hypothetical protein